MGEAKDKKIKLSKDMVGKKVCLANKEGHYYTVSNGSVGTIIDFDEYDDICPYQIKWDSGNIGWIFARDIEEVEPDPIPEMTNEEIWEMLESKMRKNGLKPCGSRLLLANGIANVYAWEDVHNAIALAYKAGYLRSQKGRPFKFGEKKKGGHWVPVDPNNLPKEGTRVRYERECEEYATEDGMIAIGDIGVFSYGKILGLPGIRFDDGRFWDWISFSNTPECLDMWVEDNE